MFKYDELLLYRGDPIEITKGVIIKQPTLNEIADFGEMIYFNAVGALNSSSADMIRQLDMAGYDYTEVGDYDLFLDVTSRLLGSGKRDILLAHKHRDKLSEQEQEMLDSINIDDLINPLELVFDDLDLSDFDLMQDEDEQRVLYNVEKDITIDRYVFSNIVKVIRAIHNYERNNEKPGNDITKRILIEEAYENFEMNKDKQQHSILRPLISTMSVELGFMGSDNIWNTKVGAFYDAVKRLGHMQNAKLLLQGAYSGFSTLKGVDKTNLNLFAGLNDKLK